MQIVRVFTRGETGGNLLGVVNDVTGLTDAQMQAIAADLGYSETTFVNWEGGDAPDVRIFTPAVEMEFAGHPLVGTSWVMNVLGPGGVDRMRCPAGMIETSVEGDTVWIDTPIGRPVEHAGGGAELAVRADMPPPIDSWLVLMPKPYVVLEYRDAASISALSPDLEVVRETFGVFAYSRDGRDVRARFFAPAGGVDEDPATGSAAVALAAVCEARGEAAGSLTIAQGEEIGVPSTIRLRWADGRAQIGGTVVRDEARFLDT